MERGAFFTMKNQQYLCINDSIALHFNERDPILSDLIRMIGELSIPVTTHYFENLVMSIIGQQLSSKAAATIKSRVKMLLSEITPQTLLKTEEESLRKVGVSYAKIAYIKDLSTKIANKELDLDTLPLLDDPDVIKKLTQVKGIGKWTAEMFLIFSLARLDVVSVGDAGLQRAARWLYDLPERKDGNYLAEHIHKWTPYCSIAALYLWEAIDRGYLDSGKKISEL